MLEIHVNENLFKIYDKNRSFVLNNLHTFEKDN